MNDRKTSIPLIISILVVIIVIGVAGVMLISAGNNANTTTNTNLAAATGSSTVPASSTTGAVVVPDTSTTNSTTSSSSGYKDGTYQANGSYFAPSGDETIGVQLTLAGGVIQSVSITPDSNDFESLRYQQRFISGVNSLVVGKKLDQAYINGRVNGASLTPEGFNNALDSIINQAKIS